VLFACWTKMYDAQAPNSPNRLEGRSARGRPTFGTRHSTSAKGRTLQVIDRTANILQQLAGAPNGLTLSELSVATRLPPATCHRLLGALEDVRLVERDRASLRWKPGLGLVRITANIHRRSGVADVDRVLEALRDQWQECFFLSVLSEREVVCIRSIETSDLHRMSVTVPLGRRLPMHASASAKAILAQLPADVRRGALTSAARPKFTEWTLTRVSDIEKDLEVTRERGYATCDQEMESGVLAHAVHLRGPLGEHRSLGVIGQRERIIKEASLGLLEALTEAATDLAGVPPLASAADI
jgi:IclR family acetate operon transcriptional repressor